MATFPRGRKGKMITKEKNCACNKQIIWHFNQPTILACENCEITFYYQTRICPYCDKSVTEFIKKED